MKKKIAYYRVKDAAEKIGIAPGTLRAMAREGKVRYRRHGIGKTSPLLFPADEIDRLVEAYKQVDIIR